MYKENTSEKQSSILLKLEAYIKIIALNAEHFCQAENLKQLHWAMWRFSNVFYAARYTEQGYEDSIGYFLESFEAEWTQGLSQEQVEAIKYATASEHMLAKYGYIHKEFIGGTYIASVDEIIELQNSKPSNVTLLTAIKYKTFDVHVLLHKLLYNEKNADLILTYYGGYKFVKGYLVAKDTELIDPTFVYAFKEVPLDIMQQLKDILNDKNVQICQNEGSITFEKNMILYYEKKYMNHMDTSDEMSHKLSKLTLNQWMHFSNDNMKRAKNFFNKKDYKLILGSNPIIKQIRKDSHHSYVQAAIDICHKTMASKESNEKDKNFVQNILNNLT